MVVWADEHRLRLSPEQPDQNSQLDSLGSVLNSESPQIRIVSIILSTAKPSKIRSRAGSLKEGVSRSLALRIASNSFTLSSYNALLREMTGVEYSAELRFRILSFASLGCIRCG
jgi:hypothetical protein